MEVVMDGLELMLGPNVVVVLDKFVVYVRLAEICRVAVRDERCEGVWRGEETSGGLPSAEGCYFPHPPLIRDEAIFICKSLRCATCMVRMRYELVPLHAVFPYSDGARQHQGFDH
jgi:hypothetical protein